MSLVDRVVARVAASYSYVGVVLDSSSHQQLLAWWPEATETTLLKRHYAHHMTIQMGPKEADLAKLPVGDKVKLKIVGWAANDQVQAVVVECEVKSKKAHPHITVACGDAGKPAHSDTLLTKGYTKISGPTLTGTVEAVKN